MTELSPIGTLGAVKASVFQLLLAQPPAVGAAAAQLLPLIMCRHPVRLAAGQPDPPGSRGADAAEAEAGKH